MSPSPSGEASFLQRQDHPDVREMINKADSLEEAIGLAVGAASACWIPNTGSAVFDSERAAVITETLLDRVRGYLR